MNNWKETTLGKIGRVITGKTPPTSNSSFYGNHYPFITPTDIKDDFNYCDTGRYLSKEGGEFQKSILLPQNSVCFTCIASIGKMCLTQQESFTNQQINSIVLDEGKAQYKFIFYLLKYLTPQIKKMAGGTITGIVNKNQFENFILEIPKKIKDQKQIAAVLSSLDDKIELLRRQNEALEKIAQGIFKEWFVNFKINGKKLKLKNGIPEEWRVRKLGEIIDLQGGFVHDTEISGKSISKIAKMGVVDGKSWFNRNSVIDYSGKIDEKFKLKEDDLIICTRDMTQDRIVIGNIAIVPKDLANIGLYAGSNTWVIKSDFNKYFLFLLFREKSFRQHIIQSSKGTTIIMITRDSFLNCDIIIPPDESIGDVMEEIMPIFEKIKINSSQIQTLSRLRDTLLPKLMSGEVEVK